MASRVAMIGWPMLDAADPDGERNGQLTLIATIRRIADKIYRAAAKPLHFTKEPRKPRA
jgi:hypothetical protein